MNELIEMLRNLPVGNIGFAGLVTLAIVLIFRGDIVPRSTVDTLNANWDLMMKAKVSENEMLKEAYRMSEKARETSAEDVKELLELARTTVHLLTSIRKDAERTKEVGT